MVLGSTGCRQAAAFAKMGADVTVTEPCGLIPEGYNLVYDTVTYCFSSFAPSLYIAKIFILLDHLRVVYV